MNSEILKLQTKIQQLEAEKQASLSLQGPEPASSSSHSSEKENTVVEAEKADGQSKEESSAQRIAALEQLVLTVKSIPRILSNVAAAKKSQLSINDQEPGSKENESISSAKEKRATSFHLELRSRSVKRTTGRCRSQLRVAKSTQHQSKAKQDAPLITQCLKRGAFIKSSQKNTEYYQLGKRRETFNDASRLD
uniref:Uncharacterized protein n=1 Tax=Panagrolaimus davidi TaxID=227884 RepID=A0A914QFC6_9BILA